MSPLFLSFTLGNDIALRSVFDLPCHLFMDVVVDLVRGAGRVYSTLNKNLYFTTFLSRYANFVSFFYYIYGCAFKYNTIIIISSIYYF